MKCSKRHKCCCVGSALFLLVCLSLSGIMFGTAWIHFLSREPSLTQGMEGTAVVLGEITQFFVQKVDIYYEYQIAETHTVEVYRYDGSCVDLPVNPSQDVVTLTQLKDVVNIYLLEGTSISYQLSLLPSNSTEKVGVFLTVGLETSDFNPHQLHKEDIICHDVVSYGHPSQCFYQVARSGYYSVHFMLPFNSLSTDYSLSIQFVNSTLRLEKLDHLCTVTEEAACDVSFSFSKSVSCLVGNILETNITNPYLTISMSVDEFWLGPVLGITMSVVVFCPLVFLIFCCLLLLKLS